MIKVEGLLFKSEDVEAEFFDITITDPRIVGMICALAVFVWASFRKEIVITDIARRSGRADSPHYISEENDRSRAFDMRIHFEYFTSTELRAIKAFLRRYFPRSDMKQLEKSIEGWYGTARHHGHGAKEHLHVSAEPLAQLWAALDLDWTVTDGGL